MFELPDDIKADIPAEHLQNEQIQRYNSVGDLIKGHIELNSLRGRSVALPADDAKPEDLDKWAQEHTEKLKGRGYAIAKLDSIRQPAPAEYQVEIEGVDPKVLAADEGVKKFSAFAKSKGMSQADFKDALQFYAKEIAPELAGPKYETIEGDAVHALLDKEFPNQRTVVVENYLKALDHLKATYPGLPDLVNTSVANYDGKVIALGDHPAFIKFLSDFAALTQPDFAGATVGGGVLTRDQAALVQQAEDIIKNPKNPKHDLYLKGDQSVHNEIQELYKRAYPGNVQI